MIAINQLREIHFVLSYAVIKIKIPPIHHLMQKDMIAEECVTRQSEQQPAEVWHSE